MFDFLSYRRKKSTRDLLDIETILQSSLKPVSPRPEFIQSLHRGLMEYTFPEVDPSELDIKKTAVFALVGLVSLVFVFSLWIRLIMVIISTLGMLQISRQKKKLAGQSH
ncbi:MAG TPA: hypothetical protein VLD65_00760 [Anaerolineales bacterium]|nr:hypothetical protein [Anaerolineales bacterium]